MKVGVLALQGDVREHLRALEEAGATGVQVKHPSDVAAVDGLIVPGGESTTIGKLLDRFELLEPIAERARSGMPLYGTCAGLILMAKQISGEQEAPHRFAVMDVTVRRNAYGRQVDSFESDLEVTDWERPLRAVFIRAPIVDATGTGVEVLASVDDAPALVREGNLLGSTFHPEMTPDVRLHEYFISMIEQVV